MYLFGGFPTTRVYCFWVALWYLRAGYQRDQTQDPIPEIKARKEDVCQGQKSPNSEWSSNRHKSRRRPKPRAFGCLVRKPISRRHRTNRCPATGKQADDVPFWQTGRCHPIPPLLFFMLSQAIKAFCQLCVDPLDAWPALCGCFFKGSGSKWTCKKLFWGIKG